MVPLKDDVRPERLPLVTWLIVTANVIVFLYTENVPMQLGLYAAYGMLPCEVAAGNATEVPKLLSSLFLHSGWVHLVGNMWFLLVFGDAVEDRVGRGRFLGLYLGAGAAAGLFQVLIAPAINVPVIGSSGSISAVLGAYILLHPKARVVTLLPILVPLRLPAFLFIGIWLGSQILGAVTSLAGAASAIAWGCHLGGFLAGLLLALPLAHLGRRPAAEPSQAPEVAPRPALLPPAVAASADAE
jgi:membrane associated rhomboid family serine protease